MKRVFPPKRNAVDIWLVCDGLTGFGVLVATGQQLGLLDGFFINALPVGIRRRSQREPSSREHENPWSFGSGLYGGLSPRKTVQVLLDSSEFLVLVVIRQHGLGFINSEGPWLGLAEIDCSAESRSMRRIWEAWKKAFEVGKLLRRPLIVVAAEQRGKKAIGRIRMLRIPDASAISLRSFVVQAIEPGSTIVTDGWEGYRGLETHGYSHEVRIAKGAIDLTKLLPRVHRVVSLLKRWILGTHQGAISPEHLDYYLDEFTFRFNRRTSQHRGKLFYRLVQQAMHVDPVPYGKIIKHVRGPKKRDHNI